MPEPKLSPTGPRNRGQFRRSYISQAMLADTFNDGRRHRCCGLRIARQLDPAINSWPEESWRRTKTVFACEARPRRLEGVCGWRGMVMETTRTGPCPRNRFASPVKIQTEAFGKKRHRNFARQCRENSWTEAARPRLLDAEAHAFARLRWLADAAGENC